MRRAIWLMMLSLTGLCTVKGAGAADKTVVQEDTAAKEARLRWWRDGRFGLFIHWGPVSLKGTEISWSRGGERRGIAGTGEVPVEVYDNLYKEFNPTGFNADDWVAIAKEAGLKYMVLTAKHCDGFALWHSRSTVHNISNSPFKRDVCAELAAACHKAGMRIGWYYSPMDWRDPDVRTERNARYVTSMQGQLRELLSHYGQIDLLWFDWDGGPIPWDQENTYRLVRTLQPKIVINNRLDCSLGGLSADRDIGANADYYTPEQVIGAFDRERPWETSMTLGTQWSWKPNDSIQSEKECIQTLVRCAGGDGNLLLNVGPTPTGEIEARQVERLKGMGRWLEKYGDTIYATRGGPYMPGSWGASTNKGDSIYLHLMNWCEDSMTLPALPTKIVLSRLLTGGSVDVQQSADGVRISVPEKDRQEAVTLVELKLDGPAGDILPVAPVFKSLVTGKSATASNVYQNNREYAPERAVDGDDNTRWATDSGTHSGWLQVDMGAPVTVDRAFISEGWDRTQEFELQYEREGQWVTFAKGEKIGTGLIVRFPPVLVGVVRLNIPKAVDGPTIWEFRLFAAKR